MAEISLTELSNFQSEHTDAKQLFQSSNGEFESLVCLFQCHRCLDHLHRQTPEARSRGPVIHKRRKI